MSQGQRNEPIDSVFQLQLLMTPDAGSLYLQPAPSDFQDKMLELLGQYHSVICSLHRLYGDPQVRWRAGMGALILCWLGALRLHGLRCMRTAVVCDQTGLLSSHLDCLRWLGMMTCCLLTGMLATRGLPQVMDTILKVKLNGLEDGTPLADLVSGGSLDSLVLTIKGALEGAFAKAEAHTSVFQVRSARRLSPRSEAQRWLCHHSHYYLLDATITTANLRAALLS